MKFCKKPAACMKDAGGKIAHLFKNFCTISPLRFTAWGLLPSWTRIGESSGYAADRGAADIAFSPDAGRFVSPESCASGHSPCGSPPDIRDNRFDMAACFIAPILDNKKMPERACPQIARQSIQAQERSRARPPGKSQHTASRQTPFPRIVPVYLRFKKHVTAFV